MDNRPKKSWHRAVVILLEVVAILFLLEAVLSILYYHKYGNDPLATIQFLKKIKKNFSAGKTSFDVKNHLLVRPDSSEEMNKQLANEAMQSNKFIYEPW